MHRPTFDFNEAEFSERTGHEPAMLASALRLARLGCWVLHVEADRLDVSEEGFRILHLDPQDFDSTAEGFIALLHPDDRAAVREVLRQALGGRPRFAYRYRLKGRDGVERLIEGDGEALREGGMVRRLVGTIMDVTEREQERTGLHRSEEKFRSLLALNSDWYWEQDDQLRFTLVTGGPGSAPDRKAPALGMRRWEITGLTPLGWTWEQHRAALEARQAFRDLEFHVTGEAAQEWYLSVSGEPFFDVGGVFLGYRGTARDITRRKVAEERLREANASLWVAMRLGRLGTWRLDLRDRLLEWGVEGAPFMRWTAATRLRWTP